MSSSDVRALLRNELATRRIQQPYAEYTSSGKLICRACNQPIKSPSLWETHLRSTTHLTRVASLKTTDPTGNRKRRLEDDEDDEGTDAEDKDRRGESEVERKRIKGCVGDDDDDDDGILAGIAGTTKEVVDGLHSGILDDGGSVLPMVEEEDEAANSKHNEARDEEEKRRKNLRSVSKTATKDPAIDEAEWAAFEQDMAMTIINNDNNPTDSGPGSALNASASLPTISAPALSAAELQQQQQQQQPSSAKNDNNDDVENLRKRKQAEREALDEEERDEAYRRLEDEFAIMESLGDRLSQLKRRRDEIFALRGRRQQPTMLPRDDNNDDDDGQGTVRDDAKKLGVDLIESNENVRNSESGSESESESENFGRDDDTHGLAPRWDLI